MSFAYIVYMSAWLRYHWPAEYLAGLLNAQPMGFYSPNSLVHDAQRHGVVVLAPDVNASWHDATIEACEADPEDIVTYLGGAGGGGEAPSRIRSVRRWRCVSGSVPSVTSDRRRSPASRWLGAWKDRSRRGPIWPSAPGCRWTPSKAWPPPGRSSRWGSGGGTACGRRGPSPRSGRDGSPSPRGRRRHHSRRWSRRERHLADLWSTGSSVDHPVVFVRERLAEDGCLTVAELLTLRRYAESVRVGGLVTHRQRPGTAGGVVFLNLEDETGLANVIVLPPVWAAYRDVARRAVAVVVEGRVEFRDGVTNLVARRFEPLEVVAPRSRDFR